LGALLSPSDDKDKDPFLSGVYMLHNRK